MRAPRISCPECNYDLRRLSERTCPECGAAFDPEELRQRQGRLQRWKRIVGSLCLSLLALYSPYSWLLFADYPWSSYRWHWIGMWPVLPGLLPAHLMARQFSDAVEYVAMGVITAAVLGVAVWLGSRGWRRLVVVSVVVFLASVLNSWLAYHAFRM